MWLHTATVFGGTQSWEVLLSSYQAAGLGWNSSSLADALLHTKTAWQHPTRIFDEAVQ